MQNTIRIVIVTLAMSFLMGSSCIRAVPDPPPPRPEPGIENCAAACANMKELGCPEGDDLEDGTTCQKFCEDTEEAGHPLNTACIVEATSCEALHSECGI